VPFDIGNTAVLCRSCNSTKGSRSWEVNHKGRGDARSAGPSAWIAERRHPALPTRDGWMPAAEP
jgi:hypothetical protein